MGAGLRMLESISMSKRSSMDSGGSSVAGRLSIAIVAILAVVIVEVVEVGLKLVVEVVNDGVFSMILK